MFTPSEKLWAPPSPPNSSQKLRQSAPGENEVERGFDIGSPTPSLRSLVKQSQLVQQASGDLDRAPSIPKRSRPSSNLYLHSAPQFPPPAAPEKVARSSHLPPPVLPLVPETPELNQDISKSISTISEPSYESLSSERSVQRLNKPVAPPGGPFVPPPNFPAPNSLNQPFSQTQPFPQNQSNFSTFSSQNPSPKLRNSRSSKPIRVDRESCYDLQRPPVRADLSEETPQRVRQILEDLRLRNSQLRHQLVEKTEEAQTERTEKELHLRQRTIMQERIEKLEERNKSLTKKLDELQSKQQGRDGDLKDRNKELAELKTNYEAMRTQLTAEQNQRQHFEQLYQQLEVSYMTVRESFVALKMRYKSELLTMRQLVQQVQEECKPKGTDPVIDLQKQQLTAEVQRMKTAAQDWKECQTRYLEAASQLEAAVLRRREDTNKEVSQRLKEICDTVASICLDK